MPRAIRFGSAVTLACALVGLPNAGRVGAEPRRVGACGEVVQLTNPSFEDPFIGGTAKFQILPQSQVPGWWTTASDGRIELWHNYGGVTAADGVQHAELNANEPSTLYQDVPTTPGTGLLWRLSHRGRSGVDTMSVLIGPPNGTLVTQASLSDGKSWGTHSGAYTVPVGQTVTRFAFQATATASSNLANGNFLDAIYFGTQPCVEAVKSVVDVNGGSLEVGDVLRYQVTASNSGGLPAAGSVLSDAVPAGTEYVAGSMSVDVGDPTGQVTDAADGDAGSLLTGPDRVQFALNSNASTELALDPGAPVSVSWNVRVLPSAAGQQVVNVGSVSYENPATGEDVVVPTNAVTVDVAPAVDLAVTKAPAVVIAAPGDDVTTTITVTNAGPAAASGVVLTDELEPGASFVSSPDGCFGATAVSIVCEIGSLPAGATVSRSIVVRVDTAAVAGQRVPDQASVTAAETELDPTDDVDNALVVVAVPPAADTDVAVDIVSSPTVPIAGTPAAALVEVINAGPDVADDVVLTITTSSGVTLLAASTSIGSCTVSGGVATCALGALAAGAQVEVVAAGTKDPALPAGTPIEVRAEVTTSSIDREPANNVDVGSRVIVSQADVAVQISATTAPVVAGSRVVYSVRYGNLGPSTARGVAVSVALPSGFVLDGVPSGCVADGGGITCAAGDMAPDQLAMLTISGTTSTTATGAVVASAQVTTTSTDPVLANNTDDASLALVPQADLRIGKRATPTSVAVGQQGTFTIEVVNAGPGEATNVVVVDPIPAGWNLAGVTSTTGSFDGASGRWSIGTMPAGSTATLTVTGSAVVAGSVVNYADVSADQFDPVSDDNTTFTVLTVTAVLPPTGSPTTTIGLTALVVCLTGLALAWPAASPGRRRRGRQRS